MVGLNDTTQLYSIQLSWGTNQSGDGHFGPFRWLDDTDNLGKINDGRRIYSRVVIIITDSISFGFQNSTFSASRTFCPLLLVMRPRWTVRSI